MEGKMCWFIAIFLRLPDKKTVCHGLQGRPCAGAALEHRSQETIKKLLLLNDSIHVRVEVFEPWLENRSLLAQDLYGHSWDFPRFPNGSMVSLPLWQWGDCRNQHTQRCMDCIGNKRRSFIWGIWIPTTWSPMHGCTGKQPPVLKFQS